MQKILNTKVATAQTLGDGALVPLVTTPALPAGSFMTVMMSVTLGQGADFGSRQFLLVVSRNGAGAPVVAPVTGEVQPGPLVVNGGAGYVIGDTVDLVGGDGLAQVDVTDTNDGKITAADVNTGGAGYAVDDILDVTGGDGMGQIRVAAVDGLGAVTATQVWTPGSGYTTAPNVATTGGGGVGCTLDITAPDDGAVIAVERSNAGSGYTTGTVATTGGTGAGLTVEINTTVLNPTTDVVTSGLTSPVLYLAVVGNAVRIDAQGFDGFATDIMCVLTTQLYQP